MWIIYFCSQWLPACNHFSFFPVHIQGALLPLLFVVSVNPHHSEHASFYCPLPWLFKRPILKALKTLIWVWICTQKSTMASPTIPLLHLSWKGSVVSVKHITFNMPVHCSGPIPAFGWERGYFYYSLPKIVGSSNHCRWRRRGTQHNTQQHDNNQPASSTKAL